MSLADRQKAGPVRIQTGPKCSVAIMLSRLIDTEADALQDMIDDPAWMATEISRALRDEGERLSASSIQRHRRGECACRSLAA